MRSQGGAEASQLGPSNLFLKKKKTKIKGITVLKNNITFNSDHIQIMVAA